MYACFYPLFVCKSAYANVYFKTTIMKQNMKIIRIAGVPSSQALPGFLITAPPSVCVPDVSGALACGFQTKKKNNGTIFNLILLVNLYAVYLVYCKSAFEPGASWLPYYCTSSCVRSWCKCRDLVHLYSLGPPGVSSRFLGSWPSTPFVQCVCVCIHTHTSTYTPTCVKNREEIDNTPIFPSVKNNPPRQATSAFIDQLNLPILVPQR